VPDNPKVEEKLPRPRLESQSRKIEERLSADPEDRVRVREARVVGEGLRDPDSRKRAEARNRLLILGRAAIPALLSALRDPSGAVRWQAAKALSQIHDPDTAADLMNAIEDEDFGVRWLAAEGLIAMGPASLEALLQGLIACFDSNRMREGAHHVLHALVDNGFHDETVEKLLRALQSSAPAEEVAWAAEAAWEKLIGEKHGWMTDGGGAREEKEPKNSRRA
jgi:hypothetical protein